MSIQLSMWCGVNGLGRWLLVGFGVVNLLFRVLAPSPFALQDTNVGRVCFPDLDQGKWTYNRTMERVLFKEPYRVCLSITNLV